MAGFDYEAMDNGGSVVRGALEAASMAEARARLREKGLLPIIVNETAGAAGDKSGSVAWRPSNRVPLGQLVLMTRQFSSLMSAKSSLPEALGAIERQTDSLKLKSVIAGVHSRVRQGSTLAAAMEECPGVFPKIYRALVAAGEKSGDLDKVLERLADYYEQKEILRQKVILASVYPLFVVGFALVAIMGLMTYVVPKITNVFIRGGHQLPWLTKALIWLSGFMSGWGLPIMAALAAFIMLWWIYTIRNEERLYRAHLILLGLPMIGPMIRDSSAAALTHALSILIGGRVPLLASLKTAADVMWSMPMKRAVLQASAAVAEGASLAGALEKSGRMPPIVIQFIATGERNGRLDEMLDRAARQQSREMESRTATLTAVLGPMLIVAMGLVVMLIVLAVLMPIFEMNQLVR